MFPQSEYIQRCSQNTKGIKTFPQSKIHHDVPRIFTAVPEIQDKIKARSHNREIQKIDVPTNKDIYKMFTKSSKDVPMFHN